MAQAPEAQDDRLGQILGILDYQNTHECPFFTRHPIPGAPEMLNATGP
jgi:hypothetical protein